MPVQFFATDIGDFALDRARSGVYAANKASGISKERLTRFFVRHDGGSQIHKSVREMCIFARQNVVKDPPFSNLDLVSCRNLLIYFGPLLQKRAVRAPGSNVLLAPCTSAGSGARNSGSMRTVPVNHSDGPFAEACVPTFLVSMFSVPHLTFGVSR